MGVSNASGGNIAYTSPYFKSHTAMFFLRAIEEPQTCRSQTPEMWEARKLEQRVVDGPNRKFNEAVGICDSNKDGKITELEAKIFAEQRYWK